MDHEIEERLADATFASQTELRAFMKETQELIARYEKEHQGDAAAETRSRVAAWRRRLLAVIRDNKELPEETEDEEIDEGGMNALRLMNKQLVQAGMNQTLLDKSTLKLMSLDYSCGEIADAIAKTKNKFTREKAARKRGRRNVMLSFCFFITVCVGILFAKFWWR